MVLFIGFFSISLNAQDKANASAQSEFQIVQASCGQCNFNLPGKGCDLAVKIDGKSYYVDGTKIDEHGDAHAQDGFCTTVRKAKVKGEVVDNRFKASYFELLPPEEKKKSK